MAPAVGIWSVIEANNFSNLGILESDVNRHLWYTVWYTVFLSNPPVKTPQHQHAPGVILRVTESHLECLNPWDSDVSNGSV